MATAAIREVQVLEALHQVPAERWGEILTFIQSLKPAGPERASGKEPILTGADLAHSDLIGIWADRTDISDSREFARQLRQGASHRAIRGKSDAG